MGEAVKGGADCVERFRVQSVHRHPLSERGAASGASNLLSLEQSLLFRFLPLAFLFLDELECLVVRDELLATQALVERGEEFGVARGVPERHEQGPRQDEHIQQQRDAAGDVEHLQEGTDVVPPPECEDEEGENEGIDGSADEDLAKDVNLVLLHEDSGAAFILAKKAKRSRSPCLARNTKLC
ncbi:MAG: hypothetical protein AAB839_01780 [Patescibacteria group bacterium]